MTTNEAIKWLKVEASCIEEDVGNGKEILEAYDMAIKALEQEPILDKIRAEIASALSEELPNDIRTQISDVGIGLEIALKIIDKHRKEDEI